MIRQAWGGVILLSASAVHAEPPPDMGRHVPIVIGIDKTREARKTALIAQGDRLRREGQFPEAARAYAEALEQGDDPVVGGRLGVLLARFGNPALAAEYLLDAIERGTSAAPAERVEFLQAYDQARAQVCRVVVEVNMPHAQILLDGEIKEHDAITGFTKFIVPGNHELRARLDGYEDAFTSFAATKGHSLQLQLVLTPKTLPMLPVQPTPQSTLPETKRTQQPMSLTSNVVGDPNYSTKEDPFYVSPEELQKAKDAQKKRPSRGAIFSGPVVVFGVASWMPAVGAVVGGAWTPNPHFSLGLEGRAAWLTVGVADLPLSAMTAGGVLSGCGHVKWFFGCALGHAGIMRGVFDSSTYVARTYVTPIVGGGGRIGARVRLSQSFSFMGTIDALVQNAGVRVVVGNRLLVDQPPIMIGSQLLAMWEL